MKMLTKQIKIWRGKFGKDYTDRNLLSLNQMESSWKKKIGITQTQANQEFLDDISHSLCILEVGCNIGNQLLCLQKMGFRSLYGIELQSYAVELSKSRTKKINIIQGSTFDIPFKDDSFGLVFTSGLLIHIPPSQINKALDEIHRCTRHYIWGCEYYSDKYEEINYRGKSDLLWKADFARIYLCRFDDLKLVKEKQHKYLNNDNLRSIFLLKKIGN